MTLQNLPTTQLSYLTHKASIAHHELHHETLHEFYNAYHTTIQTTINVKAYDARGDGVTDDRAAIQAAIDAAAAAGGGVVFLAKGTYLVSANASTPTNNIACALRLKHRVQLVGEGNATIIKLANAQNCSVISNYISTNGTEANAQQCAIRNLKIDGNRVNQTAGHGIEFSCYPLTTQTAGDAEFDSLHFFENLFIEDCKQDGFNAAGRSQMKLHNVTVYKCDRNSFYPAFDTEMSECISGESGYEGFYLTRSSIRLSKCKSFYSGRISLNYQGIGFYIYNINGIAMSSCEAQDNKASGFFVDNSTGINIQACIADSNSRVSVNSYPAIDVYNCKRCIIDIACYERKEFGGISYQQQALRIRNGSLSNQIRLMHTPVNAATLLDPITSDSDAVIGNDITINGEGGYQSVAYAASLTPDFYAGGTIAIGTLTGNITINASTYAHAGMRVKFIFTQDGTGTRTTTFNAVYKTNWTPNTAASKINVIEFVHNGTNWIQTSSTVGI